MLWSPSILARNVETGQVAARAAVGKFCSVDAALRAALGAEPAVPRKSSKSVNDSARNKYDGAHIFME